MKEAFGYQLEDARRLASPDDPATGLASDPGTGKTFTSLLAAHMKNAERILVFCPAVARPVWVAEVNDTQYWVPVRVDGKKFDRKTDLPMLHVLIVSYEHYVASPWVRDFCEKHAPFDLMILDEGHYLKNPAAKRTRYVYDGIARRTDTVWPLSGTFMLNHPGELWPHLNALAPERIDHQNYFEFTRTYCSYEMKRIGGGRTIEAISGAIKEKRPELRQRMMGMFVRRKADVTNLPPLNFRLLPLDISACDPDALIQMDALNEETEGLQRALDTAIRTGNVDALRTAEVHMARLRAVLAAAKAPAVVDVAAEILSNSHDKMLLWGWHKSALDTLYEGLQDFDAVMIRGDTPARQRERAVDRFQDDPDCRVFVGQIQAAGTAITLTAATRELFLEQAFTPALNFQAAKRAHRIGQTRSVFVQTAYIPDTIDEGVLRLLSNKLQDIRAMEGAV